MTARADYRHAAGLTGEAPHDLGPPAHFLQGAFQRVGRFQPPLESQRIGEMDGGAGRSWASQAAAEEDSPLGSPTKARRPASASSGVVAPSRAAPSRPPEPGHGARPAWVAWRGCRGADARCSARDRPRARARSPRGWSPGAPSETTSSGLRGPRAVSPRPGSSRPSSRSRWPRVTSSSARPPAVVKPQATSTPSCGTVGADGQIDGVEHEHEEPDLGEGAGAQDGLRVGDGRAEEAGEAVTGLGHRHADLALGGLHTSRPMAVA